MAKLFKTISLEERLKNSSYNNLPTTSKEVNQGSFVPKEKAKNYTSAQETLLRKIPEGLREGSIMLKKLISIADIKKAVPRINTQQAIIPPTTPFLNTKFRSAISLANRLKQVNLGTTYGLGTYFLSDTYANYIKIKPTTFNSLLLQGTFFSNGVYLSRTVIKNPIAIGSVNQGYILQLDTPATQPEIAGLQGGVGLLNKPTSLFTLSLLQGLIFSNGQTRSKTTTLDSKAEGTLTTNPYTDIRRPVELDSTRTPSDQNLRYPTEPFWSEKLKTNIKIVNSIPAPSQGNVTPRNGPYKATGLRTITFKPDGAILNTAVKFLNDYLSRNVPSLIHGNGPNDYPNYSDAVKNLHGSWLFKRTNALDFDYGTSLGGPSVQELTNAYEKGQTPGGVIVSYPGGNLSDLSDYISKLPPPGNKDTPTWNWNLVGLNPQSFLPKTYGIITLLNGADDDTLIKRAETPGGGFSDETDAEKARVMLPKNVVGTINENSLSDYATLSYTQIIAKALLTTNYTKDNLEGDFRKKDDDIKARSTPYDKDTDPSTRPVIQQYGNVSNPAADNSSTSTYTIRTYDTETTAGGRTQVQQKGRNPNEAADGRLPITIASVKAGAGAVTFSAYLTTFSDSFGVSWNDLSYVGRQDTLKTFKGVTRSGNLAFKVVSFNAAEANANKSKLNKIAQIAAVGGGGGGGQYVLGPLCTLTVGKWFVGELVTFSSLKYDIDLGDATWDIDGTGLPHVITVGLDFTVLGAGKIPITNAAQFIG